MVGGIGVNIKFICVNLLKKILVFPPCGGCKNARAFLCVDLVSLVCKPHPPPDTGLLLLAAWHNTSLDHPSRLTVKHSCFTGYTYI